MKTSTNEPIRNKLRTSEMRFYTISRIDRIVTKFQLRFKINERNQNEIFGKKDTLREILQRTELHLAITFNESLINYYEIQMRTYFSKIVNYRNFKIVKKKQKKTTQDNSLFHTSQYDQNTNYYS